MIAGTKRLLDNPAVVSGIFLSPKPFLFRRIVVLLSDNKNAISAFAKKRNHVYEKIHPHHPVVIVYLYE